MHEDLIIKPRRRRRTYTAQFKAGLVAQCMGPTASQATVAIERDMNPNVLRRWIIEHERPGLHGLDASVDRDEGTVTSTPVPRVFQISPQGDYWTTDNTPRSECTTGRSGRSTSGSFLLRA